MGKRGHSEEEILRVLREAESGDTVVEVCRKHLLKDVPVQAQVRHQALQLRVLV